MALTVIVPKADVLDPAKPADALGHVFRSLGGRNRSEGDEVLYLFSNNGENYFSPQAYADCNTHGWKCEDGMFYHVFTEALKDNLVPVDWPNSKDAEGKRIAYEDYFRKDTQYDLGDGTWLFRIQVGNQALTDVDRFIFQGTLCGGDGEPAQFLVKDEGLALIPKTEEA